MRFRSILGLVGLTGVVVAAVAFHSAHTQEQLPCHVFPSESHFSLFTGSSVLDQQLLLSNPHAQPGNLLYLPRNAPYLELCPEQYKPLVRFWYGTDGLCPEWHL